MKKLVIAVVVVLGVLGVALGAVAYKAGSIIELAVEEVGPRITGTPVTLDGVGLSLFSGQANISNLVVGNPDGFKSESAIAVGTVEVDLDIKSLFSDTIHIKRILVDGAQMSFEVNPSGSNIRTLQKNIERNTNALEKEPVQKDTAEGANIKVVIDEVSIKGTKVNLLAGLASLGEHQAVVEVPDIFIRDIGKTSGGTRAAEAAQRIFAVLGKAVIEQSTEALASGQLKDRIESMADDAKKNLNDRLRGLLPR